MSSQTVVSVEADAGLLEGTLLEPENKSASVVALIVAGSGPTDRDGNQPTMINNSLKMLAEGLSENGISSLRYDKRGIGKSQNPALSESELRFDHYIDDARRWIEYLRGTDKFDRLVVIGHSEGAMIGMVASQNDAVDMFISLASAGQPIDQLIREQLKGQSAAIQEQSSEILDKLVQGQLVENVPDHLSALFRPSVQPYMISWFNYNPQKEISKLAKPVLIVQGATDIQVSLSDAANLAFANKKAEKVVIENMNHLFKDAPLDRQKNLQTYNNPDLEINTELVQVISKFVLQ